MVRIREREAHLRKLRRKNKLKFDESTYHFSSNKREEKFIRAQFPTAKERRLYKEYRREWHCRADSLEAGDFPLAVICELVSFCNLGCEMCYTRTLEFQDMIIGTQRMLPWDILTNIVDECARIGVYSMLFSWRGESGLYRSKGRDGKWHDFADALAYARKKGILEITSLTNGRALEAGLIKKIVKAEPNWISFSIDGLDQEYNKIRKSVDGKVDKAAFDTVARNIKAMVKERNKQGLSRPQIRTNTIYPPISRDPEQYRIFMEDIGVGLVTINEMLDYRNIELPDDAVMDNWFCQYPFQRLVVSANGTILPCPGAHNEEEDIVLGRYIGSPLKKISVNGEKKDVVYPEITLNQAWHSDKIKKIRELHSSNKRKEIWACKHCRHGAEKHGITWIPGEWDMENMRWVGRRWRNG